MSLFYSCEVHSISIKSELVERCYVSEESAGIHHIQYTVIYVMLEWSVTSVHIEAPQLTNLQYLRHICLNKR